MHKAADESPKTLEGILPSGATYASWVSMIRRRGLSSGILNAFESLLPNSAAVALPPLATICSKSSTWTSNRKE